MKILSIIILISIILSCSTPDNSTPGIVDPVYGLIGTWVRSDLAFDFYANDEFMYYEYSTGMMYNYGYYIDYGTVFYLEDYISGVSAEYVYEIVEVSGDIVLRMAPVAFPDNVSEWVGM